MSDILVPLEKKPRDAVTSGARHRRSDLPCTPDLTTALFTLAQAQAILEDPMRDKTYQQTPLGPLIARWLQWKEFENGAAPDTLRDYEPPLAHLAMDNPTLGILDFTPPGGIELVRACWYKHWTVTPAGTPTTPRTRKKIRSAFVDFFEWAVTYEGLPGNPARALAVPKARDVDRKTISDSNVKRILAAQEYVGDWVLCFLILLYGLRRSGIQNAQLKHFDFEKREQTVYTKGGRVYPIPIVEPTFWRRLGELELEAQLQPDDFLLYRQDNRKRKVPLEQADEILDFPGGLVGYATVLTRTHSDKRSSGQTVHRWWYRRLADAGLVDAGVTQGQNMHRGRHTTGRAVQRHKHDIKLTQGLLGHIDMSTTGIYTEMDTLDLAAALREMNRDEWLEDVE